MTIQSPECVRADITLLGRIVARDGAAVAELYDTHARLVYTLVLRILRDPAEAEDVLQEVFLRVWQRAESYDERLGSPAAWLVRIARNRAIDRLRSRGVRDRVVESLAPETPEMPLTPEASVASGEEQRTMERALMNLPAEQRTLIEYAYYLGYTQSELATLFQLPLGTVKTRIRLGMLSLKRQLEGSAVRPQA